MPKYRLTRLLPSDIPTHTHIRVGSYITREGEFYIGSHQPQIDIGIVIGRRIEKASSAHIFDRSEIVAEAI